VEHDLHYAIARGSGNKKLAKFMDEIMNQFRRMLYIAYRKSPPHDLISDEHCAICQAIEAGDAPRARRAAYEHIERASQRAIQLFCSTLSVPQGTKG
jgi:DNA-binding GntR family transcriptional regulator